MLAAAAAIAGALLGVGGSGRGPFAGIEGNGYSASLAAHAGPGHWGARLGPDGGGGPLAVDPTDPHVVYAGGSGTVFKSIDGGAHWHAVTSEPWTRIGALAIDPADPRVVYAGTDFGVGKTVDGGRHWILVNGGLYVGEPQLRGEGVGSLVIDNRNPQTLYALRDGALFRSSNGGLRWRLLGPPAFRTRRCDHCAVLAYGYEATLGIDPNHTQTVYGTWSRANRTSLYRSSDGGNTWREVGRRSRFVPWFLALNGRTLYGAAPWARGVYKSGDGGVTWSSVGLATEQIGDLRFVAGKLYASTANGVLFGTSDGGATWTAVGSGPTLPTGGVVTARNDPNTFYADDNDGVVKSSDGGRTWATADNGLVATDISSLVVVPGSATTLYAGGYAEVFKSVDGGRTWQAEREGLRNALVGALTVDPQDANTLYAAGSWSRGLFKTSDAGVHWSRVRTPFPSNGVNALVIDPRHPRTIYVADCGGACSVGTFQKTDDGGATWRRITGIPWTVQSVAVDPQHTSTVFAGTNRGDIFRSGDDARTWHRVVSPPDLPDSRQHAILAIAVNPRDSHTVYAARRNGGVIKSTDGGKTWRRANTGLIGRSLNAFAIDPRDPRVLYVSTGQPSSGAPARVFRSTDGARTWQPLDAGLPAVGVTAFAFDPSGRTVFAATAGAGVVQLHSR